MWMGGVPPLGYRVWDGKLVVVDNEAETVRYIFRRYAELGSIRLLKEQLDTQDLTSKCWTSTSGRLWGGKPFARGALYLMLQNRIYRGEIVHKDRSYPGDHAAIIDRELWDAVQARLTGNGAQRNSGGRTAQPSLLAGLLFDSDGNRMTPSHAVKKGTRYRYYVSRPLIIKDHTDRSTGLRIPAGEIEQLVVSRVRQWLLDPGSIYRAISGLFPDLSTQQTLVSRAAEIGRQLSELPPARTCTVLTTLIERVEVRVDQVDIHLRRTGLTALFDIAVPSQSMLDEELLILSVPARLRRTGTEISMLIDGTDPFAIVKPNARLIKLLVRAHRFNTILVQSEDVAFAALAVREGVSRSYFTRVVRLSYLAPDITQAILDGRQPRDLTTEKLLAHSRLPLAWHDQRTVLGFA
jgi:hypothetical protein